MIVGTFSKSVGVIGGYAVTNTSALRAMRFMARPYLYTASLPLPVVAAAREAIQLIATNEGGLRDTLWRHARRLHAGIGELGLPVYAAAGPVGAIRLPGLFQGYQLWLSLLTQGIYVNMLIPPSTPEGDVVLRFSVSAAHKAEHIDAALAAFGQALRSLNIR